MKPKKAQRSAHELAERMQADCLGVRVGRLHRLVARRFDQALRPLGLSISQMEVLSALLISGDPLRPAVLAEFLAIERSTMSRNLALMESKGLIAPAERSASGRSMAVMITVAGIEALAGARDAWTEAQSGVVDLVGDGAALTMDGWIGRLNATA